MLVPRAFELIAVHARLIMAIIVANRVDSATFVIQFNIKKLCDWFSLTKFTISIQFAWTVNNFWWVRIRIRMVFFFNFIEVYSRIIRCETRKCDNLLLYCSQKCRRTAFSILNTVHTFRVPDEPWKITWMRQRTIITKFTFVCCVRVSIYILLIFRFYSMNKSNK